MTALSPSPSPIVLCSSGVLSSRFSELSANFPCSSYALFGRESQHPSAFGPSSVETRSLRRSCHVFFNDKSIRHGRLATLLSRLLLGFLLNLLGDPFSSSSLSAIAPLIQRLPSPPVDSPATPPAVSVFHCLRLHR